MAASRAEAVLLASHVIHRSTRGCKREASSSEANLIVARRRRHAVHRLRGQSPVLRNKS